MAPFMLDGNQMNVDNYSLEEVLHFIDEGRFAIPKLQREFVWDGPKAAKLFDSVLKGMPVGLVMVWETPKRKRLELRQKYHVLPPFKHQNGKVWFLIDGQQRISVFYRVREGDAVENAQRKSIDFSRVVLALEREGDGQQIRYRKPVSCKYESLCDILHPEWRRRLAHLGTRHLKRVRICRERIMKYPLHLMFMKSTIDAVRESFLRINTQGMKISSADAIFTRAQTIDFRDLCHEVNQHVDGQFGLIPDQPILFAVSSMHGGKEPRTRAVGQLIAKLEADARVNSRLRQQLTKDWHHLPTCFGKAIDYLRQNFSVLNQDYLYSNYMLSILALFYYWNQRGPSTHQKKQIRRWFWATTVGSRYSGKNFGRCIAEDIAFFKRLVEKDNARFTYSPQVEPIDVRRTVYNASSGGITSAFYCMLLKRKPVSIMEDAMSEIPLERYSTRANRKDRHHIFPRRVLLAEGILANAHNSICNVCLLTAEENQMIGSKRPRQYLNSARENGRYFCNKTSRHLIPVDEESGVWMTDIKRGFNAFMKKRLDMICAALEEEAGIKLFRREE